MIADFMAYQIPVLACYFNNHPAKAIKENAIFKY